MSRKHNIRNMTVIAHVDHGKTTLTDSLVAAAGIISQDKAGYTLYTDTRQDEQERNISIKSTSISMYYEIEDSEKIPELADGNEFLINLIDSPGHIDFSPEVTAALRVTDGALVVIDIVEGVSVQTETVLRQSMYEYIKPVFMINKLDRAFLELHLEPEEIYQSIRRTIETINVITYEFDEQIGCTTAQPQIGNVSFGSGLQGWAFTLNKFADIYSRKFGVSKDRLVEKLWGDHFYNPHTKKWTTSQTTKNGKVLKRAFCQFVLQPIHDIFYNVMEGNSLVYHKMLKSLGIKLTSEEDSLIGKNLLKVIMKKFLPASEALLDMIVLHLPSPVVAQNYRVEQIYTGPADDTCSIAMKNCDENGPLMLYVSKMIPASNGRFYAFGRVFSGAVHSGQKVRILGPSKYDCYVKNIQRTLLMMGKNVENMDSVPAGNIVGLVGVDQYIQKSGTITTSENAHCFNDMQFSVSPVVRIAVEPRHPKDLPKLMEGLKLLSKAYPLIEVSTEESGEHIVSGTGELHLEVCLRDLQNDFCNGMEIMRSEPLVSFKETLTIETPDFCMAKSPNKHNRIYMGANPIAVELIQYIEDEKITTNNLDKTQTRYLSDNFGWEEERIWSIGPGPNILVNRVKGSLYVNEIRDSVIAAFHWICNESILCSEPLRGVQFNIEDVTLHADAIHRGAGQILPCARRAMIACILSSKPRIFEPIFLVNIRTSYSSVGGVYGTLSRRRGVVIEESSLSSTLTTIKGYLPVLESFGFSDALRTATSGQAIPQSSFSHWQIIEDDPFNEDSRSYSICLDIRKRRGLGGTMPKLDRFIDSP
eukprot:TRINITY_DN8540_c0_g1_i1.p1 TRINITY_DN8540_c0_g1~~TRINITY_DN8540_c0_g1_i1.p1  ORF type:complete len:816 (-),score=159.99 TRINITY_DN8540_c0_g1_i1:52-2499(-)